MENTKDGHNEAPKFNCWEWMESWINAYEKQVGDGKAKEFYDWVGNQPMQAG